MVNIDGIVSIAMFAIFVAWSFIFYTHVFAADIVYPMEEVTKYTSDSITAFLSVDVIEIPVVHSASGDAVGAVFYMDYIWPSEGAKNSTFVYLGSTELSCNMTGNKLYWSSDANTGDNYFKVKYTEKDTGLNCNDGDLGGSEVNKTIPWSEVKKSVISSERITNMTGTDYYVFKGNLDLSRDFRIEINISDSMTYYGLQLPNSSNVYSRATRHSTESDEEAVVRVMVW